MESSNLKLHLFPGNTFGSASYITALLSKLTVDVETHCSSKSSTPELFLHTHVQLGKLPALHTAEGNLVECNTICRYFARKSKSLYGSTMFEETLVDQWLDTVATEFVPGMQFCSAHMGLNDKAFKYDLKNYLHDYHEFVKSLKVVDAKLNGKKHLVGTSVTIADVVLLSHLNFFFRYVSTDKDRTQVPHLIAYYEAHLQLPEFKAILGRVSYSEKAPAQVITKWVAPKQEPKKEEKKAEAKPKKAEAEDDNDGLIEEKAKVYDFPATTFDLFAFKTLYVNATNKQDALDFLWANWDEKAFSFWYLKYDKLPSEGKKLFLTNNLMSGFLDRADHVRKYCLGVHGVYGEEPELEIRGVWLWKGVEMLEPMKEHTQFDVYMYNKLDPKKAEDKALITEYWTKMEEEKDTVEGRLARTIKYFK